MLNIMPPNQLSRSLCAVCVHMYTELGPQPLTLEGKRRKEVYTLASVVNFTLYTISTVFSYW